MTPHSDEDFIPGKGKSRLKNKTPNDTGIKKIQNDLRILSNEFKEGEMVMNYIKSTISGGQQKREKFSNRGQKTISSVHGVPNIGKYRQPGYLYQIYTNIESIVYM